MKTFSKFLLEYRGSKASEKAYRLGLVSNKHGGWVDRSGKLIAKTVNGDLSFIQKRSPVQQKIEQPQRVNPDLEEPSVSKVSSDKTSKIKSPRSEKDTNQIESGKIITIVLGRFNPPTNGHRKVFDKAKQVAAGGEIRIYPSRAQNRTTDPLNPPQKIKYMRKMFPDLKKKIVNDRSLKTIFDVLANIYEDSFKKVNIIVGSDRVSEFERLANQYNNSELYSFDEIKIISAGPRDPDSTDDLTSMSSAKLRKAAVENDFPTFRAGVPRTLPPPEVENLFHAVQNALEGKNKITEMWRIAPKLYYENLRENYYQEKVFNVGDTIENLNTGLIGKISRRGPNYIICVTEDNVMFKSWIKDIIEWKEENPVEFDGLDNSSKILSAKSTSFLSYYRKSKLISK